MEELLAEVVYLVVEECLEVEEYLAVVEGAPPMPEGVCDAPIGHAAGVRRCVSPDGKPAVTHYRLLRQGGGRSLLRLRLETGRTHQIRVHMSQLGHPIFNDERYGGAEIRKGTIYAKYRQFIQNCFAICPRQALHARTLGFVHPRTGEWLQFDSALPEDMAALLDKWRKYSGQMPDE